MQANTAAYIFIYLFVSRHEVHSRNTHTLQNAGWYKQTKHNVVQGIEAGGITGYMINCQGMCKNAHFQWQTTYNLN